MLLFLLETAIHAPGGWATDREPAKRFRRPSHRDAPHGRPQQRRVVAAIPLLSENEASSPAAFFLAVQRERAGTHRTECAACLGSKKSRLWGSSRSASAPAS